TLLTWDVYRKMKPTATEAELVTFGRGSTIVLTGLGLAWIPFMKYVSPQIYIYLQSVQAYIAPPIAACFLLGVLSTRLNGIGAMAALLSGLVLGAARLVKLAHRRRHRREAPPRTDRSEGAGRERRTCSRFFHSHSRAVARHRPKRRRPRVTSPRARLASCFTKCRWRRSFPIPRRS